MILSFTTIGGGSLEDQRLKPVRNELEDVQPVLPGST